MLTDPIADMLTRIRNANQALHDTVDMPHSKLKQHLAELLQEEGYLAGVEVVDGRTLRVRLRYDSQRRRVLSGLKRESKPGRRVYLSCEDIPRVLGGMGIAVVSTSQGLLTGQDARRRGVGGELLCTAW
ncbi:MAG: 30S ribosomal protein S8 [Thermoleophilia bacterium]|nr:30S ribosomal protein S8 [Thermoleophilia bacterium]